MSDTESAHRDKGVQGFFTSFAEAAASVLGKVCGKPFTAQPRELDPIELGYVPEEKVTAALSMQWGCPVYPMQSGNISVATEFLPKTLMETGRVVPLHVQADQKVAYLAFLDRVDYTLLYSIERMTGYRTMPCVASPSRLRQALVKLRSSSRTREVVFDAAMAAVNMARIARNYGDAVGARDVSIARCAEFIWVRCSRASGATDLLFRAGEVMPSASLD